MKNKNNVEVNILVGSNSVPEYVKNDSVFIEGKEGSEYSVKVKNNNGYKVKVIIGIDGCNIVNSEPIGDSKDEIGYILEPYQEYIIKGYRIDDKSVAAFKFVGKDKAYANTDKGMEGKTTGVISCRVYKEKESELDKMVKQLAKLDNEKWKQPQKEYIPYPVPAYPRPWHDPYSPWYDPPKPYIIWTCGTAQGIDQKITDYGKLVNSASVLSDAAPQCCAANNSSVNFSQVLDNKAITQEEINPFSLGSSWGTKQESTIKEVAFEAGDYLGELIIYYSDKAGLELLGIEFKKVPKISAFPNPAPASKKYCSVPSGWNG